MPTEPTEPTEPDDLTPDAEDLARDIRADLEKFYAMEGNEGTEWMMSTGEYVLPIVIKRALAAEADAANLRRLLGLMWSKWKSGWPCREGHYDGSADDNGAFLGHVFNVTEDEEEEIRAAIAGEVKT